MTYFETAIVLLCLAIAAWWTAYSFLRFRRQKETLRALSRELEEACRGVVATGTSKLSYDGIIRRLQANAKELRLLLAERSEQIRRQATEHESILASLGEGVLATDRSGRVLEINSIAARMLGVERDQAKHAKLETIARGRKLRPIVQLVLQTGSPSVSEISWMADDERLVEVKANPLRGTDPQTLGVVLVLDDVTQLRRLENVRRDFVANVSHELRTPITSVLGFVETLLDGALNDVSVSRQFLEIVLFQTQRLKMIVNDLLLIAQVEEAGAEYVIEKTKIAADELFSCIEKLCSERARKKNITLEFLPAAGVEIQAHRLLLEQALVNLVNNAINYSNSGSLVQIKAESRAGETLLSVSDNGIGIAKAHLPRLFERFYRVDKGRSRHEGGSGLGLAIVKHIASAHKGAIVVDSEIGIGTTFTLSLPDSESGLALPEITRGVSFL